MPSKTIVDFANQIKTYMRGAEVVASKNLLDNKATTTEENGITFTVHTDKSVTLNGTSTAGFEYYLTPNDGSDDILPQSGDYVLSAGITLPEKIFLNLNDGSTSVTVEPTESYKQFTASSNVNSVCLIIRNNTTFNNLRIYPMICTLAEWTRSHTYEPYYVPVKDRLDNITPNTIYDTLWQGSSAVELDTTDVTEFNLASPYTNYKFIDVLLLDNWGNGSFVTFYGIGRGHKKGLYWAEGINGTNKTAVLSHDYTNDDNAKKLCLKVIIADGSSSFYPQAKSKVTAILGRNI